ncbi:MAG: DUF4388 domain-containing protein [Acidobacteriota bacterium]
MPLTGHLSDLSLSELIEFFCNQRKTGQLKVLYPQGQGYFYLQSGSVVDARIGVLRGIDAVYYSLTLPSAKFEFSGSSEATERTINQPWTQVVLEGLRRLDEGVVPSAAFPSDYEGDDENEERLSEKEESFADLEHLRVPSFLTFINKESMGKRRYLVAGAVTAAVLMSVAAIGVPAGWYGRKASSAAISQPVSPAVDVAPESSVVTEVIEPEPTEVTENAADPSAKRQRDRERAAARQERIEAQNQLANGTPLTPAPSTSAPATLNPVVRPEKPGARKVTVTVSYDESGRVTQASGGDASAVRIARQKRFPAGKAGSATVTIPIN